MHRLPPAVWRRLMDDYRQREKAPLTEADWAAVDAAVAAAAARWGVARRFLPVAAAIRPGVAPLENPQAGTRPRATSHPRKGSEGAPEGIELAMVHHDFPCPDAGPDLRREVLAGVEEAARICALATDYLVLHGNAALGQPGLLEASGRHRLPLLEGAPSRTAAAVAAGLSRLAGAGHLGPYALVLGSSSLQMLEGTAEMEDLQTLCGAGVHASPLMPANRGLLLSAAPEAMDLAVAQELTTAYLPGSQASSSPLSGIGERGRFRVFSLLALRLKEPTAVCTLETQEARPLG